MLGFILFIFLIILTLYLALNLANIKGSIGERQVNNILSRLDPAVYRVYHDLYIPRENNKTSQVDHIVVSPYGVFVIETKNFQGWIFGNEKSRYWTQVIYKRKEKFYNPIWQNEGHIKALVDYLEIDKNAFVSVIAFSQQSTFKFKEAFTRAKVIRFFELERTINDYSEKKISGHRLEEINNHLKKLIIIDRKIKKQVNKTHVQSIKLKPAKKKILPNDSLKCPTCSSALVQRNGKYGSFLGCTNYPKCKYTQKLTKV